MMNHDGEKIILTRNSEYYREVIEQKNKTYVVYLFTFSNCRDQHFQD